MSKPLAWFSCALLGLSLPAWAGEEILPLLKAETVMILVHRENGGAETGSGIILCQNDDQTYILTARHVLYGKAPGGRPTPGLLDISRIEISFYKNIAPPIVEDEGQEVITKQAAGPRRDLLLLTVPVLTVLPAKARSGLVPAAEPGGGQPTAYAIGYGQDGGKTQSWAAVEGKLLAWEPDALHHSAPITPGFSGGPLFNESGGLIGINIGTETALGSAGKSESYLALPIEKVIETIDKWLPATCLAGQNPLKEAAAAIYRRGMQAVSTKDWSKAERLMRLALEKWPWEGGSLHLQGMRYTLYLPQYHLGLALYYGKQRACGEALREWRRSEVQGAIRQDEKRYRKMRKLMRGCTLVLQHQLTEPRADNAGEER